MLGAAALSAVCGLGDVWIVEPPWTSGIGAIHDSGHRSYHLSLITACYHLVVSLQKQQRDSD